MNIQTHIDKNDVSEALKGGGKRFGWPLIRLVIASLLLLFSGAYALWTLYGSLITFAGRLAARSGAPAAEQFSGFIADAPPVMVGVMLACVIVVAGAMLYREIKTKPYQQRLDAIKEGLSVGKCSIELSDAHLVIKTAAKTRKIAWAAFERFEETRTTLLFRFADGGFEFIPKNALHPKEPVDKLCARLKARIERPLSRAEAKEGVPLSLSYEHRPGDDIEFLRWRRREDARTKRPFQRLITSYPIIILAFSLLVVAASLSFANAAALQDMTLLLLGVSEAGLAAVLVFTNMPVFSKLTALFRKSRSGPFGKSRAVTVTLTKTAVFREWRGAREVFQWEVFDGLVDCRNAAYLVLTSVDAIALPKRAFLDDAHYQSCIDFMNCQLAARKRAKEVAPMRRVGQTATTQTKKQEPQVTSRAPAPAAIKKRAAASPAAPVKSPAAVKAQPPAKAAAKPATPAPAKPSRQKSHQSAAEQSDGSPAAPVHKPQQSIRAVLAR